MPKKDPRIDAAIAEAAPFAKPIIKRIRALMHQACPAVEETLKWSHPSFIYQDKIIAGIGVFKAHVSFGFWHQGMEKIIAADPSPKKVGLMGRGKLASIDDLPDDDAMLRFIHAAIALNASDTPARPAGKPKPALEVPPDLAAALKKNKVAAATFEKFSPSHRREYIEWITEAKRDETRQKRLATTLEWLTEGKARHWKYENC